MKLWILERLKDDFAVVDEAQGFVVRAKDESKARSIAASNAGDEGSELWLDPEGSTCIELTADGDYGLILKNMRG